MGKEGVNCGPDGKIARLASNQHGVVSVAQLDAAGIHQRGRARRVQAGRLHRVHRGVFAVGHHGLSREGRWIAAVLACGGGAVLSHESAAELWEILRSRGPSTAPSRDAITHVTIPGNARQRRGVRLHRSRTLKPSQITRWTGIPVTTPSRTLADLRRTLPRPQFAAALRQAEFLGLPIEQVLEPDHTRSELESRFLSLCRRHRLPTPEVNVAIGGVTVDFAWPGRRLIVEMDGYRAHGTRSAFEADRSRDIELKLLGYDVVRFTWRQLTGDPRATAVKLRTLLRVSPSSRAPSEPKPQ